MKDLGVRGPSSASVEHANSGPVTSAAFPATNPSVMLGLRSLEPKTKARSLERLSRAYFIPVYKYLRLHWRKEPIEAEEVAQEFFLRSFENETFGAYVPEKGRFRTFLRTCLDRMVLDLGRKGLTQKRGRGFFVVPLELEAVERDIHTDGPHLNPEQVFEEEWLRSVVSIAVQTLREACLARGKEQHFRAFELYYLRSAQDKPTYAAIAAELHLSVTDATNRLTYARREFRAKVIEALRELTTDEAELCAEARAVLGVDLKASEMSGRKEAHKEFLPRIPPLPKNASQTAKRA